MNDVALFEAKNRLSELINRIEAGEEIAITRRGKVVLAWFPRLQKRRTSARAMPSPACAPAARA
jgi:antitoxin (DNA-binding transcriptional repressor) of toxin-antitoxin stability system